MSQDKERDREIHEMLRAPVERLAAPDGIWEQVSRRARRRRWAKAGLAAAAVVVVIAGAIPAVIGVRDHSSDEQLQVAAGQHSQSPSYSPQRHSVTPSASASAASPSAASPSASASHDAITPFSAPATTPDVPHGGSLAGFRPMSLSFVSQEVGYAWGTVGAAHDGVVAETVNAGQTWYRLTAAPNVTATPTGAGDNQIRFVSGMVGYIYGNSLFVTTNAGRTWQSLASQGYVDDIEAVDQQAWALIRTAGGPDSHTVALFHATAASPQLTPVSDVTPGTALGGADSIAVNTRTVGTSKIPSINVLIGSSAFWESPNGRTWHRYASPCQTTRSDGTAQSALVAAAASTAASVVAACGYNISGGTEDKHVWATTSAGKTWRQTPQAPAVGGYLETFSAGINNDLIIGESRSNAQISYNGGQTWQPDTASGAGTKGPVSFSFVGFIEPQVIVALASPTDSTVGAFATSTDTGKTWHLTPFPK